MNKTNTNQKITMTEYFNNNGQGFNSPSTIELNDLNIKITLYFNNMTARKINKTKEDIQKTVNEFKKIANLERNASTQHIKLYVFNDKDDYTHIGGEKHFKFGIGSEGGKYYPAKYNEHAKIFVYQQGNIVNLKHEITHALNNYATAGNKTMPTVLQEGIANYIEHISENKFLYQSSAIDAIKNKLNEGDPDINKLLHLKYSNRDNLLYQAGTVLVLYLQEKVPNLLRRYLDSLRDYDVINSKYYLNIIKQHNKSFKKWLNINDTKNTMQSINALSVKKGEFIGTKREIIAGEIKNISYYKAIINNSKGNRIGEFSPTTYIAQKETITLYNRGANAPLLIPDEYNFLKIITHSDGKYKLTFCDRKGNEYKNTQHYTSQFIKNGYHYPDIYNTLSNLIYIDMYSINGKNDILIKKDKIFSIKKLGQGDISALSIYDNEMKIGELQIEEGFFTQVEGQSEAIFSFNNMLKNLHVRFENGAYLAVTKEKEKYKASFIEGRPVNRDAYFNEAHLHKNELLEPNINIIHIKDLSDVTLKDTQILSHKNSRRSQYSDEQEKKGIIIKRTNLLNNNGSDNNDDDVYQADIIKSGSLLYKFKNIGFYISEKIPNVNNSALFIHDYGKNIRYQLPEHINSLMLVKKNDQYKLIPCDQYGFGYSDIPDEYKFIDPIFAHQYEKRYYSYKHVNLGPINFNSFPLHTIFTVKHDPNDHSIRRNSEGKIIRLDNVTYFTKVKLFHGNTEIGMLSNDFSHFKNDTFFSADFNYSYTDFLASRSPQIINEGNKISFDESEGDLGNTNSGYIDFKKFYISEKQKESMLSSENIINDAVVNHYFSDFDEQYHTEHKKLVLAILSRISGEKRKDYNYFSRLNSEKKGIEKRIVNMLWRRLHAANYKKFMPSQEISLQHEYAKNDEKSQLTDLISGFDNNKCLNTVATPSRQEYNMGGLNHCRITKAIT